MDISQYTSKTVDFVKENKVEISIALGSALVYHLYQKIAQNKTPSDKANHKMN